MKLTNKKILVLVGVSGSGKTTLGGFLKESGIPELISHTTRKKRREDVEGETYYFVTDAEFDKQEFVESSIYAGNKYGTSVGELESRLQKSEIVYLIADIPGMETLKTLYPENVVSIFIEVSYHTTLTRMIQRKDTSENILNRLKNCVETDEFSGSKKCDFIYNNEVELSKDKFIEFINKDVLQNKKAIG